MRESVFYASGILPFFITQAFIEPIICIRSESIRCMQMMLITQCELIVLHSSSN